MRNSTRVVFPGVQGQVILHILTDRTGFPPGTREVLENTPTQPFNPLGWHGGNYRRLARVIEIFLANFPKRDWKRFKLQPSPTFKQVKPQHDAEANRLDWAAHGYWPTSLLEENPRYGSYSEFEGILLTMGVSLVVDMVHHIHTASRFYQESKNLFIANKKAWHYTTLAELDISQARVREYIFRSLSKWNPHGDHSFRWDMFHWLMQRDHSGYIQHLLSAGDSVASNVWSVGEVLNGDTREILRHLHSGVPAVYNYPFFYCVAEQLTKADGDVVKVATVFQEMFASGFHPTRLVNFVQNHDQDLLPSIMIGKGTPWYQRNDRFRMALAILFYVPGVPSVFYLDWTGYEGLNLTGASRTGRVSLDWDEQAHWHFYQYIVCLLKVYFDPYYAALTHGDYRELWRPGEEFPAPILSFARVLKDAATVVVVMNNDDIPHTVNIPVNSLEWEDCGSLQEALETPQDFMVDDGSLLGTIPARTVLALTKHQEA